MISDNLAAYLQSYLDWKDRGAPEGGPYWRSYGLCVNLSRFAQDCEVRSEIHIEFRNLFEDKAFPFGAAIYDSRWRSHTQHEDPNRLTWIRDQLAQRAGSMVHG